MRLPTSTWAQKTLHQAHVFAYYRHVRTKRKPHKWTEKQVDFITKLAKTR